MGLADIAAVAKHWIEAAHETLFLLEDRSTGREWAQVTADELRLFAAQLVKAADRIALKVADR